MASDDDYMAFLNKANQDTGSAEAKSQGKATTKTRDEGSSVHAAIQKACKNAVYVSDADEPFEEVSLKYDGKDDLPTETDFAKLIQIPNPSNAEIQIMDPSDWDSDGKYNEVLDAVREASRGNDVRVYRVVRDHTRVEYWVISVAEGHIVGAKALSVES